MSIFLKADEIESVEKVIIASKDTEEIIMTDPMFILREKERMFSSRSLLFRESKHNNNRTRTVLTIQ